MSARRIATCAAVFGSLALGVTSCAPTRLSELRQPRIGVVVTPREAVVEQERTAAGVSLSIWHDGACATLGGTEVLLDGQPVSMEHSGGSMTGCLGTKGGEYCKPPTFRRDTLPSRPMHLVAHDPTATLVIDVEAPSIPRGVRVEGELRAAADALVLVPRDRFVRVLRLAGIVVNEESSRFVERHPLLRRPSARPAPRSRIPFEMLGGGSRQSRIDVRIFGHGVGNGARRAQILRDDKQGLGDFGPDTAGRRCRR